MIRGRGGNVLNPESNDEWILVEEVWGELWAGNVELCGIVSGIVGLLDAPSGSGLSLNLLYTLRGVSMSRVGLETCLVALQYIDEMAIISLRFYYLTRRERLLSTLVEMDLLPGSSWVPDEGLNSGWTWILAIVLARHGFGVPMEYGAEDEARASFGCVINCNVSSCVASFWRVNWAVICEHRGQVDAVSDADLCGSLSSCHFAALVLVSRRWEERACDGLGFAQPLCDRALQAYYIERSLTQ